MPYRRYLTLDPEAAEAFNGLSYVLTKQQRYEEAEAMAVEAIRRRPEFPEAHYNRGRALEGLDSVGEAIAEYERVLELSPTEEGVRARLGRLRQHRPAVEDRERWERAQWPGVSCSRSAR